MKKAKKCKYIAKKGVLSEAKGDFCIQAVQKRQ